MNRIRTCPSLAERVADVVLAVLIGVTLAASLVTWWTS